MKKKPLIIAAVATVALGLTASSAVAYAAPESDSVPSNLNEKLLEQRIQEVSEATGGAVVAEVRDGDRVWSSAAGTREMGGEDAAQPDDYVRVGSITKSMTTTVLMQLTEEGKLDLDAEVNEVIPEILPYEDSISVRQVLNHTAGLPDYLLDVYPSLWEGKADDIDKNRLLEFEADELLATATQHPLDFEPGSKFQYSNTGYLVAGLIVEDLTGNSWEDEVTARVLEPVGMDSTTLPESDPGLPEPHLNQYLPVSETGEIYDTTQFSPTQLWAAGVAVSTPSDINALYRALFGGELISQDSLAEMRDYTPQSEGTYGMGMQNAALGEQCEPVDGGVAEGHTGGTFGHHSESFSSPDGQRQMTLTVGSYANFLTEDEAMEFLESIVMFQLAGLCDMEEFPSDSQDALLSQLDEAIEQQRLTS